MTQPGVTENHIQAAAAILARVAMSGGEDADPAGVLAYWREREGIGGLEAFAAESVEDTVEEIERIIEEDGGFNLKQVGEALMREHMHAFQVGWICARRFEARRREQDAAAS